MSTIAESSIVLLCLEGFLYGKISLLCAITYTLANVSKEVQLFPGLGVYSGIFAIYLHCPSKEFRTAIIIFYALCLLYILSTATVVGDLLAYLFEVSNNFIYRSIIVIFISYADAS